MINGLGVKREAKKIAKANCLNDRGGGLRLLKSRDLIIRETLRLDQKIKNFLDCGPTKLICYSWNQELIEEMFNQSRYIQKRLKNKKL